MWDTEIKKQKKLSFTVFELYRFKRNEKKTPKNRNISRNNEFHFLKSKENKNNLIKTSTIIQPFHIISQIYLLAPSVVYLDILKIDLFRFNSNLTVLLINV